MKLIGCDFDGTVYFGNCSIDFFRYCAKKNSGLYRYYFKHIFSYVLFVFGKKTFKEVTSSFYAFLPHVDDPEKMVQDFWNEKIKKIKPWFSRLDPKNVILITASADFLIAELARRKGISYYVATRVNLRTGELIGDDNTGNVKVTRLREYMPDCELEEFYSDSHKDLPLARIAKRAYKVTYNRVRPWPIHKKKYEY